MQCGLPLFLGLSGNQSSNGVSDGTNRPDLSGSVNYPGTIDSFFTGNFTNPALGAWGDMGKGTVRGPGRDNWNVSLFKSFAISEVSQQPLSSYVLRRSTRSITLNSVMSELRLETLSSAKSRPLGIPARSNLGLNCCSENLLNHSESS